MQRFVPAVIVVAAACVGQSVHAQDYFKGKTVTLFAGQPPGGGIDSEMRLVAHYFGKFIPGEPVVIARNMQGAGGSRHPIALQASVARMERSAIRGRPRHAAPRISLAHAGVCTFRGPRPSL